MPRLAFSTSAETYQWSETVHVRGIRMVKSLNSVETTRLHCGNHFINTVVNTSVINYKSTTIRGCRLGACNNDKWLQTGTSLCLHFMTAQIHRPFN